MHFYVSGHLQKRKNIAAIDMPNLQQQAKEVMFSSEKHFCDYRYYVQCNRPKTFMINLNARGSVSFEQGNY